MSEFRRLFFLTVASGSLAGLLWFGVQYFSVIPLIQKAETLEAAAPAHHEEEGWHPEDGLERNAFTAVSTVLTGIGFAALLFAALSFGGEPLDPRRGALWGLAGFVCANLAPSLGLPPQPPGAAAADLFDRQIWWTATFAATAAGLYLLVRSRAWLAKLGGLLCLALPHAVGAPAAAGESVVPMPLARQFAAASLAAAAIFWLALGLIAGAFSARHARSAAAPADTP